MRGGNNIAELAGLSFGRLTVRAFVGTKNRRAWWLCDCECGNQTVQSTHSLRTMNVRSCGCYRREVTGNKKRTHGFSSFNDPLGRSFYVRWKNIRTRCNDKNNPSYRYYGGRGIICAWDSFHEFHKDMYETFLKHIRKHGRRQTTLDRIDVNGNYTKDNCRWVTWSIQVTNRRRLK